MRAMRHISIACLALALAEPLRAQPAVTPTPDRPDEITKTQGYSVSNTFEAGYRLSDVSGNRDVYRSSVNFGNGIRLFEGQLRVNSLEGHGSLFDELSFHTMGQGQDPYQSSILRVEKNGFYRYDMQFRIVNYFNLLPSLWQGEHGVNSERIFQNHELTLFPGKKLELILGYDRNNHNGPGFSSEGIPDDVGAFQRDRFLRFRTNLRQLNNQYRAGVNGRIAGLAITFLQAFDNYREDTLYEDGTGLPSLAANVQPIESLRRAEPIHGNTPSTTVVIRTENEHRIAFHGRYSYASGNRNSILSEDVLATDPVRNLATQRHTFVVGEADRKQGSGDFTVTLMPSEKWTISNTTSVNNTRINGQAAFIETSLFTNEFLTFKHLGIRHISNATEANFRPLRKFGLYGAYRFSTRRVRSEGAFRFPEFDFADPLFEQDNRIHSGVAGFRWFPASGLRFSFDSEIGRADRPFTPISEREFHKETARLRWKRNGLVLSAYFKNAINNNPLTLIDHHSESRQFGANGSWVSPGAKFTLDAGYSQLRMDTASGIFNFFGLDEAGALARTFYSSNLHLINFGARLELHPRLTLYLGYNLAKDTGDDRGSLSFASGFTPAYPSFGFDGTNFYNSFPLSYQSPLTRLSIKLNEKLAWNFGWQLYNYSEEFSGLQNYHAHIGYSSFRWSF